MSATSSTLPPCDLRAEQDLLGGILRRGRRGFRQVANRLTPEMFADPLHGAIFAAMVRTAEAGLPFTSATFAAACEAGTLDLSDVGGFAYLRALWTVAYVEPDLAASAETIRATWAQRQLMALAADLSDLAGEAWTMATAETPLPLAATLVADCLAALLDRARAAR